MWGPLDVLKETWEASEDRSEESGRERVTGKICHLSVAWSKW